MRLEIHHDNQELAARLKLLSVRMQGGLKPVMGGIGGILQSSTRERIRRDKTEPDGTPWEGWSKRTIKARTDTKGKVRGSLLVHLGMQGGLLGSITYQAQQDSVLVGTPLFYGKFLQQGTDNMPKRPFLGLSQQDYQDIDDLLADFLNGLIRGSR